MSGKEIPFWDDPTWDGFAYWAVRFTDIEGQDWWAARFSQADFSPEALFFHTCDPYTHEEHKRNGANGTCKRCGTNIPMSYLRRAMFIDRIEGWNTEQEDA
jgi:hypothetical protein